LFRTSPRRGQTALNFWGLVLIICALVALLSYSLGRRWVGGQLEKTLVGRHVPVNAQQDNAAGSATGPAQAIPPGAIQVEMEPRQPTDAEKNDLSAQELGQSGGTGTAVTAEGSSTPAGESAPRIGYTVTAGSYTSSAAAERVVSDLEKHGFSPHLTQFDRHGVTNYRVVVGIYGDKDRADHVRQQVEDEGHPAGVTAP
jgi:cell division protein FtsN